MFHHVSPSRSDGVVCVLWKVSVHLNPQQAQPAHCKRGFCFPSVFLPFFPVQISKHSCVKDVKSCFLKNLNDYYVVLKFPHFVLESPTIGLHAFMVKKHFAFLIISIAATVFSLSV